LSAIKTFVQLLPRKIDKPGFLEKFNRTVPRETNRINLLVDELLELSREPKYDFAATDLKSLLFQSIDILEEELKDQNIEYCNDIEDPLPLVQADANQLVKAFRNLSRNAAQAMPTGGRLTIKAFHERAPKPASSNPENAGNGKVILIFQDTGTGIPKDTLQHIFNPFFTTKDSGTGLGLPITHKVITEHGGQIEAESKVGEGTIFTIHLPLQG
jgi:two-component system sensor histidine kinase AtoS